MYICKSTFIFSLRCNSMLYYLNTNTFMYKNTLTSSFYARRRLNRNTSFCILFYVRRRLNTHSSPFLR